MSENYEIGLLELSKKRCKNPCAFPVLTGYSGYIVCDSG